ncbi:Golgi-associated plant pathogenesis-related protein 1-like [Ixodes scapularis]
MYCNGLLRRTIAMNRFLLTAALSTLYLAAAVARPPHTAELYQSREEPKVGASQDPSVYSDECRQRHDYYRKKHGVPGLKNNETLRLLAQDWADHLAAQPKGSPLEHRPDNKYGENIYTASSSSPSFMVNAQTPVDFWYNEIKDYDYANPGFSYKTGHFTQVVWKSTTNVGCAISKAASRSAYFVVCNYNPPGNYLGQFKQNVLPVASG